MKRISKRRGTSMLEVGNCMNHSCDPNVVAASGSTDHLIQFIACKPIKVGEEICRSYIDESLSFPIRQSILSDKYLFLCRCSLCSRQPLSSSSSSSSS